MASSSDEFEQSISDNEPFQSAQPRQHEALISEEGLDSASDQLSDALDGPDVSAANPLPEEAPPIDQDLASETAAYTELEDIPEEATSLINIPPSRPNKYRGPAATWRNWTAPERDLAASLDQLQAKDLSVHLYNAFKLKGRAGIRLIRRRAGNSDAEEEFNDRSTWIPPKVWTAWPLPPDVVPREEGDKGWEEDVSLSRPYIVRPKKPSDAMKELLLAQVLRKAKEKLGKREMEDCMPIQPGRHEAESHEDQSDGDVEGNEAEELTNLKPVVMADDQTASDILQPMVQHIITQFDDLLIKLHHARSAYCAVDVTDSESQGQTSEAPKSKRIPRKRKRRASRFNGETAATSDASLTSDPEDRLTRSTKQRSSSKVKQASSSSRHPDSENFRNRKIRLGLRDWSDVVGLASMSGWDPEVVKKTAARCSTLFDEGIKFRRLEAGSKAYHDILFSPGISEPVIDTQNSNIEDVGELSESEEIVGGVHVDGFLKPIEGKKSWKYQKKRKP
ncbi:hypothetical protein MMC28_007334 [Mycoblastus sanguinarius]|nr:hypothetical protein [Mycoblastus sanguinarius]